MAGPPGGAGDRPPTIDCAFPGGNIVVEGDRWRHGPRSTRTCATRRGTGSTGASACAGPEGVGFGSSSRGAALIGVRGPAMSLDGGASWRWLGAECVDGNAFTCEVPADADEVGFSFAMPYQLARWTAFAEANAASPHLWKGELARTRKGRPVPYARAGFLGSEPRHRVVVTCRHHCCEMMAGYSLEGLVDAVVSGAVEEAEWLRRNVEFFVVPFVDLDGVEDGDQGKNRRPHDHNRDYAGESIYPAVRAIREAVPAWGAGRLHVAADLHCPWIDGIHNEVIYVVGQQDPAMEAEQRRFSAVIEALPDRALSSRRTTSCPSAWTGTRRRTGPPARASAPGRPRSRACGWSAAWRSPTPTPAAPRSTRPPPAPSDATWPGPSAATSRAERRPPQGHGTARPRRPLISRMNTVKARHGKVRGAMQGAVPPLLLALPYPCSSV